jgi:hypothetical protein
MSEISENFVRKKEEKKRILTRNCRNFVDCQIFSS